MKALTIWQPWASLIAAGHKRIETRSWSTSYRGPLAIHAAARPEDLEARQSEPIAKALPVAQGPCPTGAIIAVCELVEVLPIAYLDADPSEAAFGGWTEGRYGWLLSDVRELADPIQIRGERSLWNVGDTITDQLMDAVAA